MDSQIPASGGAARACRLSELALVVLRGPDARDFLQGQTTNDVRALREGMQLTGLCSPKGRLLATARLFERDGALHLVVAADQREFLARRLRMYVLRSHVTVETPEISVWGLVGEPPAPGADPLFALSSGTPETLAALGLPPGRALGVGESFAELPACEPALFWAASAAAGDPFVYAATQERYVPQGINLELAGGVSFRKGCYTGQEVVSRVQHIGHTSRRAFCLAGEDLPCAPGTPVTDAAGEPAGEVLYGGAAPLGTVLLAQLPCEPPEQLLVGGRPARILPLPYSLS